MLQICFCFDDTSSAASIMPPLLCHGLTIRKGCTHTVSGSSNACALLVVIIIVLQIFATDGQAGGSQEESKRGGGHQREAEPLAPKPNVAMVGDPHVWAHCWKQRRKRDGRPGGPNYTKGRIHYRMETTDLYPCYRIRDI